MERSFCLLVVARLRHRSTEVRQAVREDRFRWMVTSLEYRQRLIIQPGLLVMVEFKKGYRRWPGGTYGD